MRFRWQLCILYSFLLFLLCFCFGEGVDGLVMVCVFVVGKLLACWFFGFGFGFGLRLWTCCIDRYLGSSQVPG